MGIEQEPVNSLSEEELFKLVGPLRYMKSVQEALEGLVAQGKVTNESAFNEALEEQRQNYYSLEFWDKWKQLGEIITAFEDGQVSREQIFKGVGVETEVREVREAKKKGRKGWRLFGKKGKK